MPMSGSAAESGSLWASPMEEAEEIHAIKWVGYIGTGGHVLIVGSEHKWYCFDEWPWV